MAPIIPTQDNPLQTPQQLLLGFLFVLPFIIVWPLANKTELPQWQAAIVFAAGAGVLWLFGSRQHITWTRLHSLVTLALATNLILSLVHTGTPGVQQGLTQQVTLALFFFLGAQYLSDDSGQQRLLKITVLSASLVATIGIAQYLSGSRLGLPAISANASVFVNKNFAGAFMDLATPAAFILLLAARNRRTRLWRAAAFFLCLSYSLVTLSRGHWLALAGAFGLLLILFSRNKILKGYLSTNRINQRLAALVMIAAPMLLLFPSMGTDISAESTVAANQLSDSGSIGDRFNFYHNTLQLIADRPFSGIGPGAFYSGFQEYYAAPVPLTITTELIGIAHAHNDYLEYLAELGIPGGFITIALLALIWYSSWRMTNNRKAAQALTGAAFLAGITAILAHATIDFPLSLPVSSVYLWAWAGAISSTWHTPASSSEPTMTTVNPRLKWLLGGLTIVYLGLVTFQAYRSLRANDIIVQAVKTTMAKQCTEALHLSDQAFELAPKDYLIWHHHLLVNNFCNTSLKGQFLAAEQVLEQDPQHPYALLTQANALYQVGNMRQAATRYQKLIQLLPHRISGYLGLANTFMANGDEQQARELYATAESVRGQIGKHWYAGPGGRILAALTVKASGDNHWAAPVRKRGVGARIIAAAPSISGATNL